MMALGLSVAEHSSEVLLDFHRELLACIEAGGLT